MSIGQVALVVVFCTLGSTVQGSTGIGLALVAGPALVSIDPAFAPGPLLIVAQLIGLRHIAAEREQADRPALRHALFGLPVGLIGAILVLELVSESVLAILVGTLAATAAAALLAGYRPTRGRRTEIIGGAASTFSGITAGLTGPPLVIAFNDMRPATMRATTALFVVNVAVVGLASLVITGNFGRHELQLLGRLVPGVIIGLVVARWVRPIIDRTWFRPTVLVISCLGGVVVVLRQL